MRTGSNEDFTIASSGTHNHTVNNQSANHIHSTTISGNTGSTGSGQGHTHSINPPYIQVYAWKRTA